MPIYNPGNNIRNYLQSPFLCVCEVVCYTFKSSMKIVNFLRIKRLFKSVLIHVPTLFSFSCFIVLLLFFSMLKLFLNLYSILLVAQQ